MPDCHTSQGCLVLAVCVLLTHREPGIRLGSDAARRVRLSKAETQYNPSAGFPEFWSATYPDDRRIQSGYRGCVVTSARWRRTAHCVRKPTKEHARTVLHGV